MVDPFESWMVHICLWKVTLWPDVLSFPIDSKVNVERVSLVNDRGMQTRAGK